MHFLKDKHWLSWWWSGTHTFSQCSKLEDLDTISKCEETDGVGEFSSSRERCQGSSSFKFLSHAHASKVFVRNVTQNMWSSIYHGENYVIYQMTFCQNLSSTLFIFTPICWVWNDRISADLSISWKFIFKKIIFLT